jgi:type III restriction enzyme
LLNEQGEEYFYEGPFSNGDDLARKTNNPTLKAFGTIRIELRDGLPCVVMANRDVPPLAEGQTYTFSPDAGVIRVIESRETEARQRYPLFNIVDRAARELGITRPTLSRIFRGMREDKKRNLFSNPEGFTNVFIATLRNVLADHLTERIAFEPGGVAEYGDAAALFPPQERYPQKEIVEAGERGLYDKVQVDSEVERSFVKTLSQDGRVEFYFKFPPRFRIRMPKIIGDYNPDWGIARLDADGKPVIHKIRETKGTVDIKKLRFEHEKRKIRCAQRYFAALGIDYRPISDTTQEWWKPERVIDALGV